MPHGMGGTGQKTGKPRKNLGENPSPSQKYSELHPSQREVVAPKVSIFPTTIAVETEGRRQYNQKTPIEAHMCMHGEGRSRSLKHAKEPEDVGLWLKGGQRPSSRGVGERPPWSTDTVTGASARVGHQARRPV